MLSKSAGGTIVRWRGRAAGRGGRACRATRIAAA